MIPLQTIQVNADRDGGRTAIVDGNVRLTWSQFARQTRRVATVIAEELPSRRPARAVFIADNSWRLAVGMAACATLGIPCTGLDHTLSKEAIQYVLSTLDPSVLMTDRRHRDVLDSTDWFTGADFVDLHLDAGVETGHTSAVAFHKEPLSANLPEPVSQPFEGFSLTSGTSGIPKIVCRSRPFAARRFRDLVAQFEFNAADVHLVTVPLYHASGPGWANLFLKLGGTVVFGPYDRPSELARLIRDEGVSTTLMVPPVLNRFVADVSSVGLRHTSRLRFVLSGGRHLSRRVIGMARENLGDVLHLYYGTTETGVNTMVGPHDLDIAPCSAGFPLPGNAVVVVGEDCAPLPPGSRGRIAIASYQMMEHYIDAQTPFIDLDPGDGRRRFFLTGDSGVITRDGRLELSGRADGVAKTSSTGPLDVNVFGLEADLLDLPSVTDAAALRCELPEHGADLVVPFVPAGARRETEARADIARACANRVPCLTPYIVRVADIPYSPTGKIRARDLVAALRVGDLATV